MDSILSARRLDIMFGLDVTLPDTLALEPLVAAGVRIGVIVLFALVLRWLAGRGIRRVVHRATKGPGSSAFGRTKAGGALRDLRPGAGERRKQRAQALGGLLTSVVTILIAGVTLVTILSVVGVPIAPLLTSAGILGIALGFGAQTLVKDYLAGIFMILEDQYGIGDWIDLGDASGEVEDVTLRVTRLRDTDGTVWYVRNGEVLRVGNQSQGWARSVLDVTVDYDTDLDRAQQVLAEEAHAMAEDPEFKGVILEEPSVWGVNDLAKDGVVLRVAIKTAPLQQWATTRALRGRVKARFDAEGITIPRSLLAAGVTP
ncbi:mechanosensitive ion channel family protein [Aeromicrobium halocynthiae]|uniref:Mechanosensitive ion channel family protein n=2 Tax=Aeromicrobium halocynthiae TaxID=560557 RepID=A0ABP5HF40_9ACTN